MKPTPSATAVVSDFKDAFPELANSNGPRGTGLDQNRDRAVREAWRRAVRQGSTENHWTIINLHMFPLDLNMGYLGHLTIPARKVGTPYTKVIISEPRFDMRDTGDAKFEPVLVTQGEMAGDLLREYEETGGVFAYAGTGPIDEDLLDAALEKQLRWHWALYHEGNRLWNEGHHNTLYINERMKDAAKDLIARKLIASAPEWVSISTNESPNKACDGCGTTIAKVAKFCPTCNQVYDEDWVKVRRPDIYRKVFGEGLTVSASKLAGSTGASVPDITELIRQEEDGSAPQGKPKGK